MNAQVTIIVKALSQKELGQKGRPTVEKEIEFNSMEARHPNNKSPSNNNGMAASRQVKIPIPGTKA